MHHPEETVSSFGPCKGSGGEFAGAEFAAGNRPWGNFSAGNSPFPQFCSLIMKQPVQLRLQAQRKIRLLRFWFSMRKIR